MRKDMVAHRMALDTKTRDAEGDALEAVLACQPTTRDGAIALLEHMSAPYEDGTVLSFAFWASEGRFLLYGRLRAAGYDRGGAARAAVESDDNAA